MNTTSIQLLENLKGFHVWIVSLVLGRGRNPIEEIDSPKTYRETQNGKKAIEDQEIENREKNREIEKRVFAKKYVLERLVTIGGLTRTVP